MSIVTEVDNSIPSSANEPLKFVTIEVTDKHITADLSDGRVVNIPLWWSWRLEQASSLERRNYEFIGAGATAYWPAIDEHLGVHGFLTEAPAPRPPSAV